MVSGVGGLAGPLMVEPKTSLSVGRGRIRDGMPVSTLCIEDAIPTYERRQGWVRHGRHRAGTRTATRPESRSPHRNWDPLQHPQPIRIGTIETTPLR